MKIVVLDGDSLKLGDGGYEPLKKFGELTIYHDLTVDKDEILKRIADNDMVLLNKVPVSKEIIDASPNIKYMGMLSTGYNVLDIKAARDRNITVTNVPEYGSDIVAQFTMGLLLEICHRIGYHSHRVKEGEWSKRKDWTFWDFPLIELADKTMGLIGYGAIGQRVAKIAQALSMKVLCYTRTPREDTDHVKFVDLDTLFANSDVISLHCPLFPETAEIINRDNIAKMKDGVIILNTARGGLVKDRDLADALNSGKVYAAGLDVVSTEPIPDDNPLLKAENAFITPHMAWAAEDARARLLRIAIDNVANFLAGNPTNVVN
ncbi:MAG: D-2-hydroxyacid dehydrogenase [Peptoniphilus sp.]|nr:D-2-hydroxyacid dehydrogenase [Peptoniphilus sp.]